MKTAVIVLILLGIIAFFALFVIAALAGAAAMKSALEQAFDDLEQEEYIAEWQKEHKKKKPACIMHKSRPDAVVHNGEEAE